MDVVEHSALDAGGRHARDRTAVVSVGDRLAGHVVAVDPAAPAGVAGRHRPAVRSVDQTLQERRYLGPGRRAASVCWLGHHGVRLIPGALVNDRGVLAGLGDALVHTRQLVVSRSQCG